LHPEEVEIALDIDRFDFAVRVEFEEGRSRVWRGQPDAERCEPLAVTIYRRSNVAQSLRGHHRGFSAGQKTQETLKPT
jgi:hypothetical protein